MLLLGGDGHQEVGEVGLWRGALEGMPCPWSLLIILKF